MITEYKLTVIWWNNEGEKKLLEFQKEGWEVCEIYPPVNIPGNNPSPSLALAYVKLGRRYKKEGEE